MANINKELNQIKNAVYGKDVRQAIHDGIEKAYNDATSGGAGDTNLEVVLARGNYDYLNKRLDASDSQLAEKATKEEVRKKASKEELTLGLAPKADQSFVDAQFASIVSGAPKGTYKTLSALKQAHPDGTEGIFLVLDDGHWYYWNEEEYDWLDGGVYQAMPWADFMTEQDEEWLV